MWGWAGGGCAQRWGCLAWSRPHQITNGGKVPTLPDSSPCSEDFVASEPVAPPRHSAGMKGKTSPSGPHCYHSVPEEREASITGLGAPQDTGHKSQLTAHSSGLMRAWGPGCPRSSQKSHVVSISCRTGGGAPVSSARPCPGITQPPVPAGPACDPSTGWGHRTGALVASREFHPRGGS